MHRASIDAVYAAASTPGELEGLSIHDAVAGIELPGKIGFKPEFRQQLLGSDGCPVRNLDDLYESANALLPTFRELLEDVAKELGPGVTVKLPAAYLLKGRDRAAKKAVDSYGKRIPGPAIAWLFDIVRATLVCVSGSLIKRVVRRLVSDPRVICAPKWKNRFAKPTPAGFRDVMLNLQLQAADGCVHTCEIQIHLKVVKDFDSAHDSHSVYEFWREYFKGSMETVAKRMADLKIIVDVDVDVDVDTPALEVDLPSLVADVLASGSTDRLSSLADLMGGYLCEYEAAFYLYGACARAYARRFGARCCEVADMCNNMALIKKHLSHLTTASDLFELALEISIETKGIEHSDVGETYNNLAGVRDDSGDYEGAVSFYEKALAVKIKAFGEEHESVAITYANMSEPMQSLGKFSDAMCLLKKALVITIAVCGPKHADLREIYSKIGCLQIKLGDFVEAKDSLEKALAIAIRTLGPEHSSVGKAYHNLALVNQTAGDYKLAIDMYEKSLGITLINEGSNHPSVANTYNNMGNIYQNMADYPNAILMYERARPVYIAAFGENCLEIGHLNSGIADVHLLTGDLAKAQPLYESSLSITKAFLGDNHPEVGMAMGNLGAFLQKIEDYDGVMRMQEGALAIFKTAFGPTHLYVGIMYGNIAAFLDECLGKHEEALAMYEEAFEIQSRVMPPTHPDIGELHFNIACALKHIGDFELAMERLNIALPIVQDALGPDHPTVKKILTLMTTMASIRAQEAV